ncbi:MAG: SurA N-terminal domain-containing protein [Ideonella sp.]
MFDFIRNHTRVLFFFLIVLIIPSFVFFGLQGYTKTQGDQAQVVASVGGLDITKADLEAAHRRQIERVRLENPAVDTKMLDTPEMRQASLDGLVRDRLVSLAAEKLHLVTTDERMLHVFRQDPQFEFLRREDGSINADVLAAQGMSTEMFEQRLRQDISANQVLKPIDATAIAPAAAASAALDAFLQRREIQVQAFQPTSYAAEVKPTDADLQAFYKEHAAQYQAPEQVDIEYLVLDADKLQQDMKVDEEQVKKYYEQNAARYTKPEERRASHILVKVDAAATPEVRAAAKAKAEGLLAEVRKAPQTFADLASKNSDDTGSAKNGGDLDFFGKGAMVKPFEDAAFALKPDGISDLVTSDFGYHIIKLTGVRGGEKRSFESVRPEIEAQLRKQLAQQKYTELAVEFSNVVYEQADSLKPAADKFKLELKTAKDVTRTPAPGVTGPLASPKLLDALFSTDATRNKRNTEAVEVAPTQMVSAHVTRHSPAHTRPFEEVRTQVTAAVSEKQAAALASKAGVARLAELKAAPATVLDAKELTISRAKPESLNPKLIDQVLSAPATSLPAVIGVDLGLQGYVVVKVNKVLPPDTKPVDVEAMRSEYAKAVSAVETLAYYDSLKRRFKVEIKPVSSAGSAASAALN